MKQQLSKLILDTMYNPDEFLREIDQMISEQFSNTDNAPKSILEKPIRFSRNRNPAIENALKTFLAPSLEFNYTLTDSYTNPYFNISHILRSCVKYCLTSHDISVDFYTYQQDASRKMDNGSTQDVYVLQYRHMNYANEVYSLFTVEEHLANAHRLLPDDKFSTLFKRSLAVIKFSSADITAEELRLIIYKLHFWTTAILQNILTILE